MTGVLYTCGMCFRRVASADVLRCLECGNLYPAVVDTKAAEGEDGTDEHAHWNDQTRLSDGTFAPPGVSRLYDAEDVEVKRLVTGHEAIDLVTGGGFAHGCSYAIHGPGGIGKSRVALAAIALACKYGPCVYALATAEEHKEDVRRHAKDAGYFDGEASELVRRNLVCLDQEDDPTVIAEKVRAVRPVFTVVDASSALGDTNFAMHLLREIAHQVEGVVLSVFHETTDGKMKGGSGIQYLVDAILDMDGVKRNKKGNGWKKIPSDEPSTYSRLRSRKNRHAAQGVFAILELTDHGFDVLECGDGREKAASAA